MAFCLTRPGSSPCVTTARRAACIEAAVNYENAAMSGLCAEGALEAAVSAIRMLELKALTAGGRSEVR